MLKLRCCFFGAVYEGSSEEAPGGNTTGRQYPSIVTSCARSASAKVRTVAPDELQCTHLRLNDIGNHQAGVQESCEGQGVNATVAVDVTTPLETPNCTPVQWSDWGSRPELEAFLPSPFLSGNGCSFSRLMKMPESLNLDSNASLGGTSSIVFAGGGAPAVAVGRQPTSAGRDLRQTTVAQLLSAVTSASWVGQGAQGAVVKAQWQSGCTVAVKWLVTDVGDMPAAYMEALLAKMLAHPFLVQTFDCAICQLDEQLASRGLCGEPLIMPTTPQQRSPATLLTKSAPPSAFDAVASTAPASSRAVADDCLLVAALDSFEGAHGERPGAAPVDCAAVLRQLGACPGKYVVQIVSEWCDAGTLHAAIRRGVFRPQPPARSRTWALRALLRTAREVAQGMCHLHALHLIHGDLKPGNVLLKSSRIDSRGFVAKVADFGLSRLCSQREEFVATADWGTVPYMAGEYLDNRLCKSSDVYSFGVLLWQMYTGRAPFAGHMEAQVAVGVMLGELQLEWPHHMPPPLLRLGQACCRHQPDQRPTFKDVVGALAAMEAQVRDVALGLKAQRAAAAAAAAAAPPQPQSLQSVLRQPPQQQPPQHSHDGAAIAALPTTSSHISQRQHNQHHQHHQQQFLWCGAGSGLLPPPEQTGRAAGGDDVLAPASSAAAAAAAAAATTGTSPCYCALRSSSLEQTCGDLGQHGGGSAETEVPSRLLSGCSFLPPGGGGGGDSCARASLAAAAVSATRGPRDAGAGELRAVAGGSAREGIGASSSGTSSAPCPHASALVVTYASSGASHAAAAPATSSALLTPGSASASVSTSYLAAVGSLTAHDHRDYVAAALPAAAAAAVAGLGVGGDSAETSCSCPVPPQRLLSSSLGGVFVVPLGGAAGGGGGGGVPAPLPDLCGRLLPPPCRCTPSTPLPASCRDFILNGTDRGGCPEGGAVGVFVGGCHCNAVGGGGGYGLPPGLEAAALVGQAGRGGPIVAAAANAVPAAASAAVAQYSASPAAPFVGYGAVGGEAVVFRSRVISGTGTSSLGAGGSGGGGLGVWSRVRMPVAGTGLQAGTASGSAAAAPVSRRRSSAGLALEHVPEGDDG